MSLVRSVRLEVFARDGGCVAPLVDPEAGPCYDRWGKVISTPRLWYDYEMDYVRWGAHGKHHELACDHVTVCPGHHRGMGPSAGYQWATAHRPELRAHLEALSEAQPCTSGSDTEAPTP